MDDLDALLGRRFYPLLAPWGWRRCDARAAATSLRQTSGQGIEGKEIFLQTRAEIQLRHAGRRYTDDGRSCAATANGRGKGTTEDLNVFP